MASGIPRECKRLAEVDFPIAEVSRYAAREKSGRPGHPSMLHKWWARRPLASSRAVLLALLLPDPCDPHCPAEFAERAKDVLSEIRQRPKSAAELRSALLWFIGTFANWEMAGNATYLRVGRGLVRAAHGGGDPPLVVDPFAGGGSIPLEALRLGCDTFASDLNPVACLILNVMIEELPNEQKKVLANELRTVGVAVQRDLESELAREYPPDPNGAFPIAYLWARTVRCEAPDCGAEIPVFRQPWLSKKNASRARYFRETADGSCVALLASANPRGGPVKYRIASGEGSETPLPGSLQMRGTKVPGNTGNVQCPCCGDVLPGTRKNPRVQKQLAAQQGGPDVVFDDQGNRIGGARLLAVVTRRAGQRGNEYRLPNADDYRAVRNAQRTLRKLLDADAAPSSLLPDEELPPPGSLGFRVQRYGMLKWRDLFSTRQKAALITLVRTLRRYEAPRLQSLLACAFDRVAMSNMSLTWWNPSGQKMQHTFGRQALSMVWDFAEVVPTANAPGNWKSAYVLIADAIDLWVEGNGGQTGQVQLADAETSPLPDQSADIWFTDPPYGDAVPYADLSDFFLVWLKRTLDSRSLSDPFCPSNPLTPKSQEAVQDSSRVDATGIRKGKAWFEAKMAMAFAEGRRTVAEDGVGSVVFAHTTTDVWEALITSLIQGGWIITGSWPIATETRTRLRARDSAALATSIHLVCRPRPEDAPVGDWADVLRELPQHVGDWMERLQGEGIRGADLVFACIGPALEIFSRYRRVETPDGTTIGLPEYLEKVWEVVGRTALENVLGSEEAKARNGLAGALEEDSRLTALFLWTLQATAPADGANGKKRPTEATDEPKAVGAKGYSLAFDVVRRFAQPLGIELPKWEKRIVETKKGVVRLLPIAERAKRLFGKSGAEEFANRMEQPGATAQLDLLQAAQVSEGELAAARGGQRSRGTSADRVEAGADATTLDHVHTAMLLQAGGRTQALRNLVAAERERGPDFERLANALSALYPRGSEEKRLLDAMLLAAPR